MLKAMEFKALTENGNCLSVATGRSEHDFLVILSTLHTVHPDDRHRFSSNYACFYSLPSLTAINVKKRNFY